MLLIFAIFSFFFLILLFCSFELVSLYVVSLSMSVHPYFLCAFHWFDRICVTFFTYFDEFTSLWCSSEGFCRLLKIKYLNYLYSIHTNNCQYQDAIMTSFVTAYEAQPLQAFNDLSKDLNFDNFMMILNG